MFEWLSNKDEGGQKYRMPVTEFLKNMGDVPYREFIKEFFKEAGEANLVLQNKSYSAFLPEHLGDNADAFFEAIMLEGSFPGFWEFTCEDAYNLIIQTAIEHFPIEGLMPTVEDSKSPYLQALAFSFFTWANINFAHLACTNKDYRKFMGIKKGWFST